MTEQEPQEPTKAPETAEEVTIGELGPLCDEKAYVFSHLDGRIRELTNRKNHEDIYWVFELTLNTPQGPTVLKEAGATAKFRDILAEGKIKMHSTEYDEMLEKEYTWWFLCTMEQLEKQQAHADGTGLVNAQGDAIDDPSAKKVIL